MAQRFRILAVALVSLLLGGFGKPYDNWLSLNWRLSGNNEQVSAGEGAEGERK